MPEPIIPGQLLLLRARIAELERQNAQLRCDYDESIEVCREWIAENARLREALEEMVEQDGCDCGHPACKRCRRTMEAREALEVRP